MSGETNQTVFLCSLCNEFSGLKMAHQIWVDFDHSLKAVLITEMAKYPCDIICFKAWLKEQTACFHRLTVTVCRCWDVCEITKTSDQFLSYFYSKEAKQTSCTGTFEQL